VPQNGALLFWAALLSQMLFFRTKITEKRRFMLFLTIFCACAIEEQFSGPWFCSVRASVDIAKP
jgi:hypothetical protein